VDRRDYLLRLLEQMGRAVARVRELLALKYSTRKAEYIRDLARAVVAGTLDLDALSAAADDQPPERVRLIEDRVVAIATQQSVRNPERQTVDDDAIAGALELLQARNEIEGLLDRPPVRGARGAMTRDALRHVLVARLGGGDEDDPLPSGDVLDGEAALAATGAADDEER